MRPLSNCHVLYTRAYSHYLRFEKQIELLGGNAYSYPLMDTHALELSLQDIQTLQEADYLIFTSVNAVKYFPFEHIYTAKAIAIGKATEKALKTSRIVPVITAPPPYTSESLLSIFQPIQKNILIIAAPNGRTYLYQNLVKNNPKTSYLYNYARYNPSTHWTFPITKTFDALVIASQQTLNNLIEITPQTPLNLLQCNTCMLTFSERISCAARKLGFETVLTVPQADEIALIETLTHWWLQKRSLT
ncbi:uroporphyrinogen-III synthase [Suttonella ornithocola]|uniref:Uroporphyrinogen-III synthase n=1 Tax=Suttonella ornithocola TaxID=279832 RepID=A0A380MVH0_9GAMM|nr:uroporphyrinogen-III synthase [Suttonella ornithocola]SUO96555.1 uroporphyrinogen-III synthase [Suttonella ornithocola]